MTQSPTPNENASGAEKCPVCKGEGVIRPKDDDGITYCFDCPKCHGAEPAHTSQPPADAVAIVNKVRETKNGLQIKIGAMPVLSVRKAALLITKWRDEQNERAAHEEAVTGDHNLVPSLNAELAALRTALAKKDEALKLARDKVIWRADDEAPTDAKTVSEVFTAVDTALALTPESCADQIAALQRLVEDQNKLGKERQEWALKNNEQLRDELCANYHESLKIEKEKSQKLNELCLGINAQMAKVQDENAALQRENEQLREADQSTLTVDEIDFLTRCIRSVEREDTLRGGSRDFRFEDECAQAKRKLAAIKAARNAS